MWKEAVGGTVTCTLNFVTQRHDVGKEEPAPLRDFDLETRDVPRRLSRGGPSLGGAPQMSQPTRASSLVFPRWWDLGQ